ncbi:unnamed protein product, partial [marine sediment metagenome]
DIEPGDLTDEDRVELEKSLGELDELDEGGQSVIEMLKGLTALLAKSPAKLVEVLRGLRDDDEEEELVEEDEEEPTDEELDAGLKDLLGGGDEEDLEEEELDEEDDELLAKRRQKAEKSLAANLGQLTDFQVMDPDEFAGELTKSITEVVESSVAPLQAEIKSLRKQLAGVGQGQEALSKSLEELGQRPAPGASPYAILHQQSQDGGGEGVARDEVYDATIEGLRKGLLDASAAVALQKAAGTENWPQYEKQYGTLLRQLA